MLLDNGSKRHADGSQGSIYRDQLMIMLRYDSVDRMQMLKVITVKQCKLEMFCIASSTYLSYRGSIFCMRFCLVILLGSAAW